MGERRGFRRSGFHRIPRIARRGSRPSRFTLGRVEREARSDRSVASAGAHDNIGCAVGSSRCDTAHGRDPCQWQEIVTKTAVVIVDDHQVVRQGLRGLIEAQPDLAVVGEAETGAGALRCMALIRADLMILDLDLPDISGLEVLTNLSRDHPKVRVLVFSSLPADLLAAAVLDAGAAAYVSKAAGSAAILEALRLMVRDLHEDPEGWRLH